MLTFHTFLRSKAFRQAETRTYVPTEPPKLQLDDSFSSTMSLSGFNNFLNETSTPTRPSESSSAASATSAGKPNRFSNVPVTPSRQNGTSPAISNSSTAAQKNAFYSNDTPTKQLCMNGSRASPPLSKADFSHTLSQALSNPGTPASEISDLPWSAAVGRATTGKSGRVIERLMGDVDRLQREKKLATVKLEEEVKRSESARLALEMLRATNENLIAMREADRSALARRERKIEELKADLDAEKSRREKAEKETVDTSRERDEIVGSCRKEVLEEKELSKKSTSQYETLSSSWKALDDGYRRQILKLNSAVQDMNDNMASDKRKLAQLEVVVEQLGQEGEKARIAKVRVSEEYEAYKKEKEDGIKHIRETAERNEVANEEALKEMEKVLGEMKYVIAVQQNLRAME
ncbi:hypothetical protein MMC12_006072 [Toensbergia leucococca]|nr:hypothetical protein [Toensbergia leucococca]